MEGIVIAAPGDALLGWARSGADGRAYQRTAVLPRRLGFLEVRITVLSSAHACARPPDGCSVSGLAYGSEVQTADHDGAASGSLSGRLRIGTSDGVFTSRELGIQHALNRFMGLRFRRLHRPVAGHAVGARTTGCRWRSRHRHRAAVAEGAGVVYRDYCGEPHFLYCGRHHPLFAMPDSRIDQSAVDAARFSVRSYRYFDDLYLVGHPRASASVIDMEAQLMLILSQNFIGFLPAHYASSWVPAGDLRAIKPGSYTCSRLSRRPVSSPASSRS